MTLGIAAAVITVLRMLFLLMQSIRVSGKVHKDMLSRIIRAPCNLFFDRVPVGRLLNRFSKDLNIVDRVLAY